MRRYYILWREFHLSIMQAYLEDKYQGVTYGLVYNQADLFMLFSRNHTNGGKP